MFKYYKIIINNKLNFIIKKSVLGLNNYVELNNYICIQIF